MYPLTPTARIDTTAHVFVLADNERTQCDLARILEEQHIPVRCYHDAQRFFAEGASVLPACIIVDWQLGPYNGVEISDLCRRQWPLAPMVLISDCPTVPFTVSAMQKGVSAVVEKPVKPINLLQEVQTAIESTQCRCGKKYDPKQARERIKRISDLELEILKFIADGVPNKNIAAAMALSLRTVEKYRHSLFETLEVNSAAEATRIWVLANLES